jgi:hypothetical protein
MVFFYFSQLYSKQAAKSSIGCSRLLRRIVNIKTYSLITYRDQQQKRKQNYHSFLHDRIGPAKLTNLTEQSIVATIVPYTYV